jgi:predicted RND superfamily exporter protein
MALETLPTVSKVQSVDTLLPENQEDKIEFLKQMRPVLAGVTLLHVSGTPISLPALDDVFGKILFKMVDSDGSQWGASKPLEAQMIQVRNLIDQLRARFHAMEKARLDHALHTFEDALLADLNDKLDILLTNVNTSPMRVEDLPKSLLQRFVSQDDLYLIRVFPAHDIWEPELLGRFVSDLRSVEPDVVGDPVTLYIFTQAFRDACIKAAIYAGLFIFALLLFTFRNLVYSVLAMMPLVVGTIWTLGLMRCFGVNLNLANSLFLPLVVGAGVEYGIIVMQRWREQAGQGHSDVALPFSTAKGIILAGLTTTVGFGSLTISDHQGIHSLGVLAIIGSLSILAAAVLFLPALLQIVANFAKYRKA